MFTAKDIADGTALDFAVPTDVQALYGSARYFNGTSTLVNLTSDVVVSGAFDIGFTFVNKKTSGTNAIIGNSGTSTKIRWNTGLTSMFISSDTDSSASFNFDTALLEGVAYDIQFTRDVANLVTMYIDGVAQASTGIVSGDLTFNRIGYQNTGGAYSGGVIYDVNINDQAAYTGLGTSVTAWEDTIGSNNGTEVNGATFTGQGYDAYMLAEYDQSGGTNDGTETNAANQAQVVKDGALTLDGVSNIAALFDVTDDWTFANAFTGLTAANVYAITDNAGVVTLDTLTSQDITLVTTLSGLLTSLTYDHVTAVLIYPDATDQAEIEAKLLTIFSVS